MPYITKKQKEKILKNIIAFKKGHNYKGVSLEKSLEIIGKQLQEKGELTYCVYKLAMEYMKKQGITFEIELITDDTPCSNIYPRKVQQFLKIDKGSYTEISNAISTLDDAAHELRRRFLNDYEDLKIFENGDVK